jgi:hypothetical protein
MDYLKIVSSTYGCRAIGGAILGGEEVDVIQTNGECVRGLMLENKS